MSKRDLPAASARAAADAWGPATRVTRLSDGQGVPGAYLWTGSRGSGILKLHRSPRTYRQELRAYTEWLPGMPGVPRLVHAHAGPPHALVLERLPGRPLAGSDVPAGVERALHACAGRWLKALHGLPVEDVDDVSLADAYRLRWTRWRERWAAAGSGTPVAVAWAGERLLRALPHLADAARVPCHRDFAPRNWLVTAGGPGASGRAWGGVIDFEHARPDHPWADLSRLAAYVWPARPDLERAFWDGYGTPPTGAAREAVAALAVLDAVQRWMWASRRGDDALVRSARAALIAHGAPDEGGGRPVP